MLTTIIAYTTCSVKPKRFDVVTTFLTLKMPQPLMLYGVEALLEKENAFLKHVKNSYLHLQAREEKISPACRCICNKKDV